MMGDQEFGIADKATEIIFSFGNGVLAHIAIEKLVILL